MKRCLFIVSIIFAFCLGLYMGFKVKKVRSQVKVELIRDTIYIVKRDTVKVNRAYEVVKPVYVEKIDTIFKGFQNEFSFQLKKNKNILLYSFYDSLNVLFYTFKLPNSNSDFVLFGGKDARLAVVKSKVNPLDFYLKASLPNLDYSFYLGLRVFKNLSLGFDIQCPFKVYPGLHVKFLKENLYFDVKFTGLKNSTVSISISN